MEVLRQVFTLLFGIISLIGFFGAALLCVSALLSVYDLIVGTSRKWKKYKRDQRVNNLLRRMMGDEE